MSSRRTKTERKQRNRRVAEDLKATQELIGLSVHRKQEAMARLRKLNANMYPVNVMAPKPLNNQENPTPNEQ